VAGRYWRVAMLAGLALVAPLAQAADDKAQQQSLDEVRNTVINLLQALVDRGLITREQAEALVKQAQEKAAAEAARNAAQAKEEANAVRVPYVPEIVKDEIAKSVEADLAPSIQKSIEDNVSSKGSLAAALPEWVQRIHWGGDMRLRLEGDKFAKDNATGVYFDYNQVNSKGGFQAAGPEALLNVSNDQTRLRLRARVGLDADLGSGWSTSLYLATGSTGEIIATTNQTLGTYGAGYTVTIDQGFLRWTGDWSDGDQVFTA